MMQIPLQAIGAQTLSITLAGQNCQLNIYSKFDTVYMDVYESNLPVALGVQCQNGNRIIRYAYLATPRPGEGSFVGDLIFVDTQGSDDPTIDSIGSRFVLEYLDQSDLATLGFAA